MVLAEMETAVTPLETPPDFRAPEQTLLWTLVRGEEKK